MKTPALISSYGKNCDSLALATLPELGLLVVGIIIHSLYNDLFYHSELASVRRQVFLFSLQPPCTVFAAGVNVNVIFGKEHAHLPTV